MEEFIFKKALISLTERFVYLLMTVSIIVLVYTLVSITLSHFLYSDLIKVCI